VFQQAALEGMKKERDTMMPRVQQVMRQTRARIFHGITDSARKIVSLFEPTTEIIRKGKAGKPTEFGKMVKIQEADNQIITRYEVYEKRPSDSDLLVPAIEEHQRQLGRVPKTAAADAGFYSAKNEAAAQAMGVEQVAVSVTKRRHGLERSRYKGDEGIKRWVGLGVIADTLINIGRVLVQRPQTG
jgi:transposase, IS5 family